MEINAKNQACKNFPQDWNTIYQNFVELAFFRKVRDTTKTDESFDHFRPGKPQNVYDPVTGQWTSQGAILEAYYKIYDEKHKSLKCLN